MLRSTTVDSHRKAALLQVQMGFLYRINSSKYSISDECYLAFWLGTLYHRTLPCALHSSCTKRWPNPWLLALVCTLSESAKELNHLTGPFFRARNKLLCGGLSLINCIAALRARWSPAKVDGHTIFRKRFADGRRCSRTPTASASSGLGKVLCSETFWQFLA